MLYDRVIEVGKVLKFINDSREDIYPLFIIFRVDLSDGLASGPECSK